MLTFIVLAAITVIAAAIAVAARRNKVQYNCTIDTSAVLMAEELDSREVELEDLDPRREACEEYEDFTWRCSKWSSERLTGRIRRGSESRSNSLRKTKARKANYIYTA